MKTTTTEISNIKKEKMELKMHICNFNLIA